MEHFIGKTLAVEHAYGPAVLKRAFARLAGTRPQELSRALGLALAEARPQPVAVNPAACIPSRSRLEAGDGSDDPVFRTASYWIYVSGGPLRIEIEGRIPAGLTARLEAAQLQALPARGDSTAWATVIPSVSGSWRRLEFEAPEGRTFTLRQIRLTAGQ
jgi:hypothetical protein